MRMRLQYLLWSSGSLATGSVYNAMAIFGLFYMTSVLGIAPAIAGALLFVTKLYDAVTDPLMGAISDRTKHPLGPRRPYLVIGALLLGASFALFFSMPELTGGLLVAAVVFTLLLQSTGYTIYAVPYLAMAPDIAQNYEERTRLMSLRLVFLILGVMVGSVLGPMIVEAAGDNRRAYMVLGCMLGVFSILTGLLAFFGTKGVKSTAQAVPSKRFFSGAFVDVIAVFKLAPFRLLTMIKLLQLIVLALSLSCMPYFFSFVLERPVGDIGKYILAFTIAGLISIPLWKLIIDRLGKRNVYAISIAGYGVGLFTWFLWVPGEPEVFFYLRGAILGILANGTLFCALALLPDTMEYDRLMSGDNREGVMSGVFTTVEKIAVAFGSLIIGGLLQVMGLISNPAEGVAQPESALTAIRLGVSIVPAFFCFAAIPLLLKYRLDSSTLKSLRLSKT